MKTKIFDAHFHVIDPSFSLVPNQGYVPPYFTIEDYKKKLSDFDLDVIGGAIVTASFQGFDQSYLIQALKKLEPSFVGVTQLPFDTSDKEIFYLNQCRVRALRFNLKRGDKIALNDLKEFAHRVYDLVKWHIEVYIDFEDLKEMKDTLLELPSVCIDHLGLSENSLPILLKLAEKDVKIKATGFGRLDYDPKEALRAIASVNPDALLFGTDLPSTRAKVPFKKSDVELINDLFDSNTAAKILHENALKFYRI